MRQTAVLMILAAVFCCTTAEAKPKKVAKEADVAEKPAKKAPAKKTTKKKAE